MSVSKLLYNKILPSLFEIQDKCEWIPIISGLIRVKKKAISYLHLQKGDKVLITSIGGGFELDFIISKIGPEGFVVGIDFSESMLGIAQRKIEKMGWKNVKLINMDLNKYDPERDLDFKPDAILSNFGYMTTKLLNQHINSLKTGGYIAMSGPQPLRGIRQLLYPITFVPEMVFGLTWKVLQDFPNLVKIFHNQLFDIKIDEDTFGKYFVAISGKKSNDGAGFL